jgi:DNA-binding MarR family transcriptional regulator
LFIIIKEFLGEHILTKKPEGFYKVLFAMMNKPGINISDIVSKCELSYRTVRHHIKVLIDEQIIERRKQFHDMRRSYINLKITPEQVFQRYPELLEQYPELKRFTDTACQELIKIEIPEP